MHTDLLIPGYRALDIGCGSGEDSADLMHAGLEVIGLDRSERQLKHAREHVPDVTFIAADITEHIPFPDEHFQLVVASLSIHYFPWTTTEAVVREVARVMQPGATFLCRVNRVGDVNFDYGVGREVEPEFFEVSPGHFKRFFTEQTLAAALGVALTVESIVPSTTTRWGAVKQILVARAKRGV
jgi:ubiquinone/menaquinone biosynthesis C-methylase UbiE